MSVKSRFDLIDGESHEFGLYTRMLDRQDGGQDQGYEQPDKTGAYIQAFAHFLIYKFNQILSNYC